MNQNNININSIIVDINRLMTNKDLKGYEESLLSAIEACKQMVKAQADCADMLKELMQAKADIEALSNSNTSFCEQLDQVLIDNAALISEFEQLMRYESLSWLHSHIEAVVILHSPSNVAKQIQRYGHCTPGGDIQVVVPDADTALASDYKALLGDQGWISVDERLPEELQVVLVFGTSDNPHRQGFECGWLINGGWTCWFTKDITHWMPLPISPEGGK